MLDLNVNFLSPVFSPDKSEFIHTMEIDICGYCPHSGERIIVGKLMVDQLLLHRINNDADIFSICDEDSQGWCDVYFAIFNKDGSFRQDLCLEEAYSYVLFIWKTLLHPCIREHLVPVIEAINSMPVENCISVLHRYYLDATDKELVELGYSKMRNHPE